jgi:hypothetical protein
LRPDVKVSSKTREASGSRLNVCSWLYEAFLKQVTGSGRRSSVAPFEIWTSIIWVVAEDVFADEIPDARNPGRSLNTFVEPLPPTMSYLPAGQSQMLTWDNTTSEEPGPKSIDREMASPPTSPPP